MELSNGPELARGFRGQGKEEAVGCSLGLQPGLELLRGSGGRRRWQIVRALSGVQHTLKLLVGRRGWAVGWEETVGAL